MGEHDEVYFMGRVRGTDGRGVWENLRANGEVFRGQKPEAATYFRWTTGTHRLSDVKFYSYTHMKGFT